MNRRSFLRLLGLLPLAVVAPKLPKPARAEGGYIPPGYTADLYPAITTSTATVFSNTVYIKMTEPIDTAEIARELVRVMRERGV